MNLIAICYKFYRLACSSQNIKYNKWRVLTAADELMRIKWLRSTKLYTLNCKLYEKVDLNPLILSDSVSASPVDQMLFSLNTFQYEMSKLLFYFMYWYHLWVYCKHILYKSIIAIWMHNIIFHDYFEDQFGYLNFDYKTYNWLEFFLHWTTYWVTTCVVCACTVFKSSVCFWVSYAF